MTGGFPLHRASNVEKIPFDDVILTQIPECTYLHVILLLRGPVFSTQYCLMMPHYNDVIMSAMASQITGVSIVYWTVCSGADQRIHQSSASLVFVGGFHRWPVYSPHKGQWRGKCFHLMTSSWYDGIHMCRRWRHQAITWNNIDFFGRILWHPHERNFTASLQTTILYTEFENDTFEITVTYVSGQRDNVRGKSEIFKLCRITMMPHERHSVSITDISSVCSAACSGW